MQLRTKAKAKPQRRESASCSRRTSPVGKKLGPPGEHSISDFEVSKKLIHPLRHGSLPRKKRWSDCILENLQKHFLCTDTKCTRSCLQFGDQILTVLSEASQRDRHCRRCLPETGSTRSTISLEGSAPTLYNRRNQQDCPKCRRRKWLGQRVRTVHVTCGGFSSKFKTHRVASELRILELLRTSTGNDHRQVRTALPSFRHE